MVASAARQVSILMEKVDSNGLLPIRWTERGFLDCFLIQTFPAETTLSPIYTHFQCLTLSPKVFCHSMIRSQDKFLERWPPAHDILESLHEGSLASFPIDHSVPPSPSAGESVQQVEPWRSFSKRASIDTRIAETILTTMPRAASQPICILVTSQSIRCFRS